MIAGMRGNGCTAGVWICGGCGCRPWEESDGRGCTKVLGDRCTFGGPAWIGGDPCPGRHGEPMASGSVMHCALAGDAAAPAERAMAAARKTIFISVISAAIRRIQSCGGYRPTWREKLGL